MKVLSLVLTLAISTAFLALLPDASANFSPCTAAAGHEFCAGYTLDTGKEAVCYGVVMDSFTGPFVVACTGDNGCPTYYDVYGRLKGCQTDAGLGDAAYFGMRAVDSLLP